MPSRSATKSAPTTASGQPAKSQKGVKKTPQPDVKLGARSKPAARPDPVGPIGSRQAHSRSAQAASKRSAAGAR